MLTFFRKIRKVLLESGAISKYLLYAIGEIALVVIGILIALQINNWNEFRKDRVKEREVLVDVVSDLERNCENLTNVIESNNACDRAADLIISMIHGDPSPTDSLPKLFHGARIGATSNLSLTVVGFEALKNTGFDILQSDTLKDAILDLYEAYYPRLMNFAEMFAERRPERMKFIDQRFITEYGGRLTAIDLDALLDDIEYFIFLKRLKQDRYAINNRSQRSLRETQKVLQLIQDELGKNNK